MYNRLTIPIKLCEKLEKLNVDIILLDNNSSYPPLIKWYETCKYKVIKFDNNLGHKCLFKTDLLDTIDGDYFIYTDHDLDIDGIPDDTVNKMIEVISSRNDIIKCGLSLEINDLPDNGYAKKIYDWELKFWDNSRKKADYYISEIDTTFALYDKRRLDESVINSDNFFRAVRLDRPYVAKHIPWYNTPENISEEELFYMNNTTTYWSNNYKEIFNKIC
jgi:hypothetical protein